MAPLQSEARWQCYEWPTARHLTVYVLGADGVVPIACRQVQGHHPVSPKAADPYKNKRINGITYVLFHLTKKAVIYSGICGTS